MIDPYETPTRYELLRPRYVWDGGIDDVRFVKGKLRQLVAERGRRYSLAVELGCGTGRFSTVLGDVSARLIATDPSRGMIDYCRNTIHLPIPTEFREAAAENVVSSGLAARAELVAAFWSLTYPIQSFFQLTLTDSGELVQVVTNEEAQPKALSFIARLTAVSEMPRTILAIVFLADSIEQRWVTDVWRLIGPLPGGSRDRTWDLLQARCAQLRDEGHDVSTEVVNGSLVCRDETSLRQVFLEHHLRGLLPHGMTREQLGRRLLADMDSYRYADGYRIPAGFRWLSIKIRKPN